MAAARAATRSSRKRPRPQDWSTMDVERFMAEGLGDLSEEEEEEEEGEGEGQHTAARRKRGRKESHRAQLSRLAESDTDFHDFLKKNDPDLLTFDLSEDEAVDDSDVGDENESTGNESDSTDDESGDESDVDVIETPPSSVTSYPERSKVRGSVEDEDEGSSPSSSDKEVVEDTSCVEEAEGTLVTMVMAKMWVQQVSKKQSLSAMKKIALALHGGVVNMVGGANTEREAPAYRVDDSQVFNLLLVASLKNMAALLDRHLPPQGKSPSQRSHLATAVGQYLRDVVVLLKGLGEPSMLAALLRHVQALLCHFAVLPKVLRELTRQLVVCWSQGEEHVRVLAFLTLRRIVLLRPHPTLSKVVKRLYLAFVRNCKLTTEHTLPAIHFMQSSLVELARMDPPTTYHHAFVYIRQLAVHLRTAISSRSKEAAQPVANWQFLHCISLWSRVLAEVGDASLQPLVFPMVQVTTGVMQLLPAHQYCPLRLHCIASLHLIARELGVFIPTAPYLLDVLRWKGVKSVKGAGQQLMGKPLDLSCVMKLTASQLNSKSVQTSILDHAYELVVEYFVINSHSIAFPELVLPTLVELNKVAKETHFSWFKRQIKQLVDKVNEVASAITRQRSTVTFAPKDAQQIAEWERENSLNQNTLESFLLSWRQARQRQLDADKEVVQPKRTSQQLCGQGRARGGAGGAAEPGWGEIGDDKDTVMAMFPL